MDIIVHCSIADINFTNLKFLEGAISCYTLCTCECVVSCFIYVQYIIYSYVVCLCGLLCCTIHTVHMYV